MDFFEVLSKERLLFDGSMGALLSAMGRARETPELWNVEAPDVIEGVHRGYVEAGADVAITNTLGASPIKLKRAGLSARCDELIRAGVACARRSGARFVALDLGVTGGFLRPVGALTYGEMYASFYASAQAGREAGADFALLETMTDIAECRVALLAARDAGLPVAASFTFEKNGRTLTGGRAGCAALSMRALGARAVGVNCSGGPGEMLAPLSEMRAATPLPVIVQPNAGLPAADAQGRASYPFGAEAMAEAMRGLVEAGAAAIGGCCGTTPAHIRAMAPLAHGAPPETAWDGEARLCSPREMVSLADARRGLVEADCADDLYELDPDDPAALLSLDGLSPAEAEALVEEALMATGKPLAFRGSDADALEAALRAYPGVAGVDTPLAEVCAKYGAVCI